MSKKRNVTTAPYLGAPAAGGDTIIGGVSDETALARLPNVSKLHVLWRREGVGRHIPQQHRARFIREASEQIIYRNT